MVLKERMKDKNKLGYVLSKTTFKGHPPGHSRHRLSEGGKQERGQSDSDNLRRRPYTFARPQSQVPGL